MVKTDQKWSALPLLVVIQLAQIVVAGNQTSPQISLFGTTTMLTLHSSPFDLFERLDQQIASAERVPNAEILDGESAYTVRLELPGVERDSIDIKATNRDLVICAQRPAASMSSDIQAPLLSEFRAGSWSRSFRFPHSLDREQLKATYRDGILEITAGKAIEHTSVSVTLDD